jgi:hypothetical protein
MNVLAPYCIALFLPIGASRHASQTLSLDVYAHLFNEREDRSAKAINDAVAALLSAC